MHSMLIYSIEHCIAYRLYEFIYHSVTLESVRLLEYSIDAVVNKGDFPSPLNPLPIQASLYIESLALFWNPQTRFQTSPTLKLRYTSLPTTP